MSYKSGSKTPWHIPKMYKEETIFVLGSGPSLGLLHGSTILKDKIVISVHDAFQISSWVKIHFMGDARAYWEKKDLIDKLNILKVSTNIQTEKHPSVEGLSDIKVVNIIWKIPGLNLDSDTTLRYNGGAGACCIDFAAHLGARRIVLFGFDNKFKNGRLHYFPSIHEKPSQIKVWGMERIWKAILQDSEYHKIEIVNATPDSALPFVKRVDLEDYI